MLNLHRVFAIVFVIATITFCLPGITIAQTDNNRIEVAGQPLFISGANVAWIDFARDIGPGNTRLHLFEEMFKEMNEHGGNSFRLWLHTNGISTPQFSGTGADASVIGPGVGAIEDLRNILDLAYKYDISLKLCLWSFDMLQSGLSTDILTRNRSLFTDDAKLDAYLNNALIPMVEELKGHPAILAWEIFNEPEGMTTNFGWTPAGFRVTMNHIQKFVNRAAGAIKRTDPNVPVTNGSWSFRASSDLNLRGVVYTNFYRDDRLIAAGGDSLGVLDFYSVHYYKHFTAIQSPFNYNASHWGLDKPIVIAEFYLSDPRQDGQPDHIYGVHWSDLYETLYNRGYAGAMGWQWFDWWADRTDMEGVDGTLSWPRMLENMKTMVENHPDDVFFQYPGLRLELKSDDSEIEQGQSTWIRWKTRGSDRVILNGSEVAFTDSLKVTPSETTTFTITATDANDNNNQITESVTITVIDPMGVDRLYQRPAQSTIHNANLSPINDNNSATIWTASVDGEVSAWVDMQKTIDIAQIDVQWGSIRPTSLTLHTSYDGFTWFPLSQAISVQNAITSIELPSIIPARFLRLSFTSSSTAGVEIASVSAYGVISSLQVPMVSMISPMPDDYYDEHDDITFQIDIIDGHEPIQRVFFFVNDIEVSSTTETPFRYVWENVPAGQFEIHAIAESASYALRTESTYATVHPAVETIRLEAETAALTGTASTAEHTSASGGGYVRMQDATNSSLTWNNIQIEEGGDHTLRIGFRLPFDSPKGQHVHINGQSIGEIMFSGEQNQWLFLDVIATFNSGLNTITINGSWGWMDFDFIEIRGRGITTNIEHIEMVKEYRLDQNYPNPFNPTTVLRFQLPKEAKTRLSVYDVLGRQVAVLVDELMTPGIHHITFAAPSTLATGVYIVQLRAGSQTMTQKIMLVK